MERADVLYPIRCRRVVGGNRRGRGRQAKIVGEMDRENYRGSGGQ